MNTKKIQKLATTTTFYEKVVNEIGEVSFVETSGVVYKIMGERDCNFMKMFYENFINVLEDYFSGSSFKVSILKILLLNADKDNCIYATGAEIAESLNTTTPNVQKELKKLQDCNFIKKIKNGVYQLNVDCVYKGSAGQREKAKMKFSKPLKTKTDREKATKPLKTDIAKAKTSNKNAEN